MMIAFISSNATAACLAVFIIFIGRQNGVCEGVIIQSIVLLGNSTSLECVGNDTGSGLNVVWIFENGERFRHYSPSTRNTQASPDLFIRDRFHSKITSDDNGASLEIGDVSYDDAGNYSCIRVFTVSGKSTKIDFELQIIDNPVMVIEGDNATRHDISARCCVEVSYNVREYNIKWLMDEDRSFFTISKEKETETFLGNEITKCSVITFERHRHYHRKTLECLLRNEYSVVSSVCRKLDVWYAASFGEMADNFLNSSFSLLVQSNEEFNITCNADGNPIPRVHLEMLISKNEWIKFETTPPLQDDSRNSWRFLHPGIDENTVFRCNAQNQFDGNAVSNNIVVEVMYLAKVEMLNKTLKIKGSKGFNISCRTGGKPRPVVKLMKQSSSGHWHMTNIRPVVVVEYENTFTVNFYVKEDEWEVGNYSLKCEAFQSLTNKTVESLIIRLEIETSLLKLVEENLNSVVIAGAGVVVIITIIATGISRRRKSFYNIYSTVRPGNFDGAFYNRSDASSILSPIPVSGNIPDLCRFGTENSSANDHHEDVQRGRLNDDYDEVNTEEVTLTRLDQADERPRRDESGYTLPYNHRGDSKQPGYADMSDLIDNRDFETTYLEDTYTGYSA